MTDFSTIYIEFKDKITDYDLPIFEENVQNDMLRSLLNKACVRFYKICKQDLNMTNENDTAFISDLSIDEIDILSEWMVHYWIAPFRNNSEYMRPFLNTKDFSMISPANLLNSINNVYENSKNRARSIMNSYSYREIGGFEKLKPR